MRRKILVTLTQACKLGMDGRCVGQTAAHKVVFAPQVYVGGLVRWGTQE